MMPLLTNNSLEKYRGLHIKIFLFLLLSNLCYAHKLKVFATAEESTITGYGYFSGGKIATNAKLDIQVNGNTIQSLVTDAKGEFTFTAKHKANHKLILSTTDGHQSTWTVQADELSGVSSDTHTEETSSQTTLQPTEMTRSEDPANKTLEILVSKAVAKQIIPLRRELEAYQEKVRLHDILGGIGFILGLTGITLYFKTKK